MTLDKEIDQNMKAIAQRHIELQKETEALVESQRALIQQVEKNDLIIRENMRRMEAIDEMFS